MYLKENEGERGKVMKSREKCEDDLGNAVESGYDLNTLNSCIKVPESNIFFKKN